MSRRIDKGKLPPFVPLLKETINSAAWRAMSHGARSLYVALKSRYNLQAHNNGRLYLAQRKAAEEIRARTDEITRWYRELQYYGFIRMASPGYLGANGKGTAPRWRLTELGYLYNNKGRDGADAPGSGGQPTRDFLRWNGVRFSKHQAGGDRGKPETESRPRKGGRTVPEKGDTPVPEKGDTSKPKCPRKGGQTARSSVPEKGDKSSKPLGWCVGGAFEEGATSPPAAARAAPGLRAIVGGKAKVLWSTPTVTEVTDPFEAAAIRRDCERPASALSKIDIWGGAS